MLLSKLRTLSICPLISINFLRHAGIFTAEEVIYIAREKLIRLQSLYLDQFRRLQYTLREKRRKYLHALKKEKETLCKLFNCNFLEFIKIICFTLDFFLFLCNYCR